MDKDKALEVIIENIHNDICPSEFGLKDVDDCGEKGNEECILCWRIATGLEVS